MSWEGLGHNPVPGRADAVLQVATALDSLASEVDAITGRLDRVHGGTSEQIWHGEAAAAFRVRLAELRPEISRLARAHREAEDAMRDYAVQLKGAQDDAWAAETKARAGIADRGRAAGERSTAAAAAAGHAASAQKYRYSIRDARIQQLTAVACADQAWHAKLVAHERQMAAGVQREEQAAGSARAQERAAATGEAQAAARVMAAQALGQQAAELRDYAARQTVQRLDAAGPSALSSRNPIRAVFDKFKDGLRDIVTSPAFEDWLSAMEMAGTVLTIAGIALACFGGPVGMLVGGGMILLGKGLTIGALAGTVLSALYGKRSWWQVAAGAADVLLPFPALKTAKTAEKIGNPLVREGVAVAGQIRRALFYGSAEKATILRHAPRAPALKGFDRIVVNHFPVRPRDYYRARLVVEQLGPPDVQEIWDKSRGLAPRPGTSPLPIPIRIVRPIPPLVCSPEAVR